MSEIQRVTGRRRSVVGAAMTVDDIRPALRAKLELKRLGDKPHRSGHGHAKNVRSYVENDTAGIEHRFVLMEYNEDGNKQLKSKMMTHLEAWKRNETLRGTGFAWAKCDNTTRMR